jgi:hypothetical protein
MVSNFGRQPPIFHEFSRPKIAGSAQNLQRVHVCLNRLHEYRGLNLLRELLSVVHAVGPAEPNRLNQRDAFSADIRSFLWCPRAGALD